MKFLEIPRFIQWGRPVEKLVRDHPATTLSLASIKLPNTVSTFSIWKTQKEMMDYAYQNPKHREVVKLTRQLNWYKEEMFARFVPYKFTGTWAGKSAGEFLQV